MNETDFIARLRGLASDPAARELLDDTAVLPTTGADLIITCDLLVEGIHFLPADPAEDVAWKLLAVNLSDLAAKGARPLGVLLGYSLRGEPEWHEAFATGLGAALRAFDVALLGGDTIAPSWGPRTLSLTAIGRAGERTPSRAGAQPGDGVWISGWIGDGGAGLALAGREVDRPESLLARYRRPQPRIAAGAVLARHASAMMDVSDGLLLDLQRLASASGVAATLDLETIPLSDDYRIFVGEDREARLAAATSGDDYELLFTAPDAAWESIRTLAEQLDLPLTRVGSIGWGAGLAIADDGEPVPLPDRLGYQHG